MHGTAAHCLMTASFVLRRACSRLAVPQLGPRWMGVLGVYMGVEDCVEREGVRVTGGEVNIDAAQLYPSTSLEVFAWA